MGRQMKTKREQGGEICVVLFLLVKRAGKRKKWLKTVPKYTFSCGIWENIDFLGSLYII